MPAFFRFFWFICAAFMLVNLVTLRRRLALAVAADVITAQEADQFFGWLTVGLVGVPCLLGVIGLVARWSSPFCAGVLAFDTPARALVSFTMIVGWLVVLKWIWLRDGAQFLARVVPWLGKSPRPNTTYSPALVRLVVTGTILFSAIVTPLTWRSMPVTPPVACPALAGERSGAT